MLGFHLHFETDSLSMCDYIFKGHLKYLIQYILRKQEAACTQFSTKSN